MSVNVRIKGHYYSDEFKNKVIEYYVHAGETKKDVWRRFTKREEGSQQILRWMRQLGYLEEEERDFDDMFKRKKSNQVPEELIERQLLEERIEQLESKLSDAEMKALAYSKMIEVAEQEFDIRIRKKYDTKP